LIEIEKDLEVLIVSDGESERNDMMFEVMENEMVVFLEERPFARRDEDLELL
jgi:methionine synthase II (cobalamin-independent)